MGDAIRWLMYIYPSSVVAYDIAFLEVGFNSDAHLSSKSTMKSILSIIRALALA